MRKKNLKKRQSNYHFPIRTYIVVELCPYMVLNFFCKTKTSFLFHLFFSLLNFVTTKQVKIGFFKGQWLFSKFSAKKVKLVRLKFVNRTFFISTTMRTRLSLQKIMQQNFLSSKTLVWLYSMISLELQIDFFFLFFLNHICDYIIE